MSNIDQDRQEQVGIIAAGSTVVPSELTEWRVSLTCSPYYESKQMYKLARRPCSANLDWIKTMQQQHAIAWWDFKESFCRLLSAASAH